MRPIEIKLSQKNNTINEQYQQMVVSKIREKYTINNELAILRQRDTRPEEFAVYNEYVEACKAEIKAEIGGQEIICDDI